MRRAVEAALVVALTLAGVTIANQAAAYSVLAHEANIDAQWTTCSTS